MTLMVWLCAALTLSLALYGTGHLLCVLVIASTRRQPQPEFGHPTTPISVLVPARDEGAAAVRALKSLMAQDHAGPTEIILLVKDDSDSAIPFLEQAFGASDLRTRKGRVQLADSGRHSVYVAFTGLDLKSDKVNWGASRVETPLLAILDCDHQADPDWLRSSVCLLQDSSARIVQSRRAPLYTDGFFQLWDSLHQHIGCELFNHAFTRMRLTVFFTGTTAVMETALLKTHPLHECITEDVNLSYEILSEGERIIHNPHSGSSEDVSPDLFSFLARRRRWASGHTEAFFRHLGGVLSGPISLREKLQFIFHGMHYMVCIGVFALHLVIGVLFLEDLSITGALAAALSSLVLASWVSHTQRSREWATRLSETAVLLLWFFPAVVICMSLARALLLGDFSTTMLPLHPTLQLVGLVGLATPLVVLLAGLARFRQLSPSTAATVILTYPAAFYLDLSGVLIGVVDCAARRRHWHTVSRTAQAPDHQAGGAETVEPASILDSWSLEAILAQAPSAIGRGLAAMTKPSRFGPAAVALGISCSGVLYSPETQLRVAELECEVQAHDGEPWIVPATELSDHCGALGEQTGPQWANRTGSLRPTRIDALSPLDTTYWDKLDTTFFCNEAVFTPQNVQPLAGGGVHLHLEAQRAQDRDYTSASIASKTDRHLYGRYEVTMKPARGSGVLTAFFLYRFDPWQEIDFEFLGKDTTKALLNVFYNPGNEGDLYNYGYRGTPVIVDLGFDAADDYHRYAIEWEPGEIRWFADDQLIHRRKSGRPTPVPHLPMRFHINVWPICSAELAGPLDTTALPTGADIMQVSLSEWQPPAQSGLPPFLSEMFSKPEPAGDWRQGADWIQPRR